METKQPIAFVVTSKEEIKAVLQFFDRQGLVWNSGTPLFDEDITYKVFPYAIGVANGDVGVSRGSVWFYTDVKPASSLLATEVFKAIKRHDQEIHV